MNAGYLVTPKRKYRAKPMKESGLDESKPCGIKSKVSIEPEVLLKSCSDGSSTPQNK